MTTETFPQRVIRQNQIQAYQSYSESKAKKNGLGLQTYLAAQHFVDTDTFDPNAVIDASESVFADDLVE